MQHSLSYQIISSHRLSSTCHRFDPDCRVCGKPIYWRSKILFAQRMWHLECFHCCRCRKPLKAKKNGNEKTDDSFLAILGEDMALRCSTCDGHFQLKKKMNRPFQRKGQLWNCSLAVTSDKQRIDSIESPWEESRKKNQFPSVSPVKFGGDLTEMVNSDKHGPSVATSTPHCTCTGCRLFLQQRTESFG